MASIDAVCIRSCARQVKIVCAHVCVCLLVLVLCLSFFAFPVGMADARAVSAELVLEVESGRVLHAQQAYSCLPMASTTKILTAITVLEHIDPSTVVTVSKKAVGTEGSSIYLREGERWKVEDLLYGLMLRSGNDAAVQLALSVGGSIEEFARMMNHTAVRAGATKSNFVNPHGLHDGAHYTTAYDLALITAYALRNPIFRRIVGCKVHRYQHPSGEQRSFENKNKMLRGFAGADGVKTGYTQAAGRCLVTSATRDGMQLVCVVLNVHAMWQRSATLLDGAFKDYKMVTIWQPDEVKYTTFRAKTLPVRCNKLLRYPLQQEELGKISLQYSWEGRTDPRGEVTVALGDRVLFHEPISVW